MTNIFEKLALGWIKENKDYLKDLPYSDNFFEMEIIGNKRTGDQIEEWTSPISIEIAAKFDNWDGKSQLQVEIPNDGKGEVETFRLLFEKTSLPKKLPELGYFNLYKSSKVTDFISGSFLSHYGIIISKKAKVILEQFNLGTHMFYPIKLEHKKLFYPEYYLLKSLASSDNHIDIQNSTFYFQKPEDNAEGRTYISFKNQKEIDEFHALNKGDNYFKSKFVYGKQLVRSPDFPNYDLFYSKKFRNFSDSNYPFISERLKNALEGTSGIEFEPTKRIKGTN